MFIRSNARLTHAVTIGEIFEFLHMLLAFSALARFRSVVYTYEAETRWTGSVHHSILKRSSDVRTKEYYSGD